MSGGHEMRTGFIRHYQHYVHSSPTENFPFGPFETSVNNQIAVKNKLQKLRRRKGGGREGEKRATNSCFKPEQKNIRLNI